MSLAGLILLTGAAQALPLRASAAPAAVVGTNTAFALQELGVGLGVNAGLATGTAAAAAGGLMLWSPAQGPAAPGWQLASTTLGGAWLGRGVGELLAPVADGETAPAIGALSGQFGGLAVGMLARPRLPDGGAWATLDGAVLAGDRAGHALADLWGLDTATDRRARAGLRLGLSLGAGGVTHWRLAQSPAQANGARIATGLAVGAAIGAALPVLLAERAGEGDIDAGLLLGASAGTLLAANAPLPPASPRAATSGLAWALAGGATLTGAGGRVPGPTGDRVAALGAIAGTTAGLATGLAIQPRYGDPAERTIGTPLFLGMSQLQAAAAGAALGTWAAARHPDDPSAPTEIGLMGFGLSSAAGLAVPALGPLTAGGSAAAGSAGAWGAGLAGAAGAVAQQARPARDATAAIIGEVGTITVGIATAGRTGPSLPQVAWVDGLGLMGLGVGTLVSFAVTPEPTWRAASALAGSALGLGTGLMTAGRWGPRDAAAPALPRWPLKRPPRWRAHLLPGPWFGGDGTRGVSLKLEIEELRP